MKRNSVMNYEKAYKEALERAKNLRKDAIDRGENIRAKQCEIIFPELNESEDEKIIKELITHCRNTRCVTEEGAERIAKWIAWLEKQGEHKDYYTKQELIDMGFSFTLNGDIVTPDEMMDDMKKYLAWKEKQGEQTINQPDFEIPFGAKDSELIEESYYIPKGYHAVICKDKVTIKKGEQEPAWSAEDTFKVQRICKYLCEAKKYYADITEVREIQDEGIKNFVEYVPFDSFIEKACEGIEKLLSGYIIRNFNFGDSYDIDKLIEDFKNYMKGE